jgi:hypothetical protein
LLLRIVGALNSAHIFGALVPVEEPSTASQADSCTATKTASLFAVWITLKYVTDLLIGA